MRVDLTAALGPLAAAQIFFAWERAIAERMARDARTASETAQNTTSCRFDNNSPTSCQNATSCEGGA
jgi:hypothetical protein